jgi:hypothetical protein
MVATLEFSTLTNGFSSFSVKTNVQSHQTRSNIDCNMLCAFLAAVFVLSAFPKNFEFLADS